MTDKKGSFEKTKENRWSFWQAVSLSLWPIVWSETVKTCQLPGFTCCFASQLRQPHLRLQVINNFRIHWQGCNLNWSIIIRIPMRTFLQYTLCIWFDAFLLGIKFTLFWYRFIYMVLFCSQFLGFCRYLIFIIYRYNELRYFIKVYLWWEKNLGWGKN